MSTPEDEKRDEVLKRMLATPPKPHEEAAAKKPKTASEMTRPKASEPKAKRP